MQVSSEAQRLMHGGRQPALYRAHSASCSQRAHGYLGYQIVAGAAVVHRLDLAAEVVEPCTRWGNHWLRLHATMLSAAHHACGCPSLLQPRHCLVKRPQGMTVGQLHGGSQHEEPASAGANLWGGGKCWSTSLHCTLSGESHKGLQQGSRRASTAAACWQPVSVLCAASSAQKLDHDAKHGLQDAGSACCIWLI